MGRMPTAVTVVAATAAEGPLGATANAVTSLSLEPPLMLACLDRGSRTLGAVEAAGRFAINVLGEGQDDLARRFATKDPHDEKWSAVGWSERAGVPRIDGVPLWIACHLDDVHPGGDHLILVGEVVDLDLVEGAPLLFHGGGYRALGDA
jgi:3-hydroxy-9,10-secoandrosta-1,3,5(10)-triene-9,17-dione monooxygenase reductase component